MQEDPTVQDNLIARMKALSTRLDDQAKLLKGAVVLLDYPVHGNVGDLLIWRGEQAFLKRNNKTLLGQYSKENITHRTWQQLDACDTICLHGGGNFGDLWPVQQRFREEIIHRYPQKRLVVFPQSVHFKSQDALDRSCEILRQHNDLHILVRDKYSLNSLQEKGVQNVVLCPDMAHALWGGLSAPAPTTDAPLHLLRDDREQGFLPPSVLAVADRSVCGWSGAMVATVTGYLRQRFGMAFPID